MGGRREREREWEADGRERVGGKGETEGVEKLRERGETEGVWGSGGERGGGGTSITLWTP